MFCACEEASPNATRGEAIIEGLLLRRGKLGWSKRHVVLRTGELRYSRANRLLKEAKVLLEGAAFEDVDEPGRHDFHVVEDGFRHKFRCASFAEKARWLRGLAEAAGRARPAPPTKPAVHGIMIKKGKSLWNRRTFLLRGRSLEWADEGSQDRAGGRLDLANAKIKKGKDLTIEVKTADRNLKVRALNKDEFQRWLRCLEAASKADVSAPELKKLWAGAEGERKRRQVAASRGPSTRTSMIVAVASLMLVVGPKTLWRVAWPPLRYVVLPIAVVLWNLWYFRQKLMVVVTWWLRSKLRLELRHVPRLDAGFARDAQGRVVRLDVVISDLIVEDPSVTHDEFDDEDEDEDGDCDGRHALAALDHIVLSFMVRRIGKSRRRRLEIMAEVVGLVITYASYDRRFRDTNLTRLLAKMHGDGGGDDVGVPEPEPEPLPETPAKDEEPAAPRSWKFCNAQLKQVVIRLVAASPLGSRTLGAVTLHDERVDVKGLTSVPKILAWLNGLALRALANAGFDAVDAAFAGATTVATSVAFAPLDIADHIAERLGGSKVVTGVTGGVRGVVGGVVGGAVGVVSGGAAAGRILVQGATSGDLNAMGESLGAAGGALAGGVTGAVTSSLSGVAGVADGFSN